jgi:hypothetical protein
VHWHRRTPDSREHTDVRRADHRAS